MNFESLIEMDEEITVDHSPVIAIYSEQLPETCRHHGGRWRASLKPLEHYSDILSIGVSVEPLIGHTVCREEWAFWSADENNSGPAHQSRCLVGLGRIICADLLTYVGHAWFTTIFKGKNISIEYVMKLIFLYLQKYIIFLCRIDNIRIYYLEIHELNFWKPRLKILRWSELYGILFVSKSIRE